MSTPPRGSNWLRPPLSGIGQQLRGTTICLDTLPKHRSWRQASSGKLTLTRVPWTKTSNQNNTRFQRIGGILFRRQYRTRHLNDKANLHCDLSVTRTSMVFTPCIQLNNILNQYTLYRLVYQLCTCMCKNIMVYTYNRYSITSIIISKIVSAGTRK